MGGSPVPEQYHIPIAVVLLLAGLAMVASGIVKRRRRKAMMTRYESLQGTVVELVPETVNVRGNRQTMYRPRVEYTVGSEHYTVLSDVASPRPGVDPGSRLEVRYDPSDPSKAILMRGHYTDANAAIGMGCFFVVMGALILNDALTPGGFI